jgi:two-component system, NtrC family, sensor histidine kinase PilS
MIKTKIKTTDLQKTLNGRILFLSLLKVLLISILIGLIFIVDIISPGSKLLENQMQRLIFGLITVEYFMLVFLVILLKKPYISLKRFFIFVLLTDSIITTVFVHISGGVLSPYAVFYMISIISACIALSSFWAGTITVISLVLYFLISIFGWLKFIPPINGQTLFAYSMPLDELMRRLSLNSSAFASVSALSIYLSNRLNLFETRFEAKTEEFRELEIHHKDILSSLKDGVITLSDSGIILTFNNSCESILNIKINIGDPLKKINLKLFELFNQKIPEAKIEIESKTGLIPLEVSIMDLSITQKKIGYILVIRDRKEIDSLEKKMIHREKLAALGRFSAGIAHEIRNPLASISGSLELLKDTAFENQDDKELLDLVFNEINRLNNLINDLLTFTQNKNIQKMKINISHLIKETITLVKSNPQVAHRKIKLINGDDSEISIDPDSMRQVIFNLILNGLHADEKGELKISINFENKFCYIIVEDKGKGIPDDIYNKIFEPFFTTKKNGTGLGLALAKKIVEQHNGEFIVERPKIGTIMKIKLPIEQSPEV